MSASKEISKDHLIALENLLESASASELHTSLEDLFFSYLAEKNVVLPTDEMVQHIYYLVLFLRELE